MSEDVKQSETGQEEKTQEEVEAEDRVDEHALSVFECLGYKGRLPDDLVSIYNEFKRRKDMLQPGRVSAEGFAFIVLLVDLHRS